ncbi:T9SS type A sorting domain-containing protein [Flavivirga spongiicola]|uniref:T9SS type A sorting domain-containing protein n=1 Tax=Flavivirga spongiicola TaxID=421621 RepID=A0ABU7XSQ0_9FLAO|nr:T9SS type A sorting domain-containing protein [Flavivirga sp. MEBiC05379]MDO5978611.1 T9SS type A sorting domain-containing protein [Flavivirga sp. MEBiC05379]
MKQLLLLIFLTPFFSISQIQIGNDIDSETDSDLSSWSISLSSDGTTAAVGSIDNDENGVSSGRVRVYKKTPTSWTQVANDIYGEADSDLSGWSVSLSSDGSVVAIGAPLNDGKDPNGTTNNSGHVRVYKNISGVWTQIGSDIDGETASDQSGYSVSLSSDGSMVAISAPGHDGNGINSGHVQVYKNTSGVWTQAGNDIDGEATADRSGDSVSLSSDGSMVAIWTSLNGSDINLSPEHIRVYKYESLVDTWKQIDSNIDGEKTQNQSGSSLFLPPEGPIETIKDFDNTNSVFDSDHLRAHNLSAILSSDSFVLSQFGLYPNPANNQITIGLIKGLTLEKISIYNNLGQFILTTQKKVIDTSGLSVGLYYVEVITNKGKATKKIVIK